MEVKETKGDRSEKLILLIFMISVFLIIVITMVIYLRGERQSSRPEEEQTPNASLDQNQTLKAEGLQVILNYGQLPAAQTNGIPSEHVLQETAKMGKEETLLILGFYLARPRKWRLILEYVRQHIDKLPLAVKKLYQTANTKQLLDRMSTKLEELINEQAENIKDLDIRLAVQDIRITERILGRRLPSKRREQDEDIRDIGTPNTPNNTPKMKGSRKNKRSLIDVIGGNLSDKKNKTVSRQQG